MAHRMLTGNRYPSAGMPSARGGGVRGPVFGQGRTIVTRRPPPPTPTTPQVVSTPIPSTVEVVPQSQPVTFTLDYKSLAEQKFVLSPSAPMQITGVVFKLQPVVPGAAATPTQIEFEIQQSPIEEDVPYRQKIPLIKKNDPTTTASAEEEDATA